MKRILSVALSFVSTICLAQTANFHVEGHVVTSKGKGIENVVVNDGVHFVTTDKNGHWALDCDTTESKFVSISTPADYELPQQNGLARFYKPIREIIGKNNTRFVLTPRKKQCNTFTYIAISDPQVRNESNMERWRKETVADLQHVADSVKRLHEVIAVNLGDLVFDNMPLYKEFEKSCQTLGVTTFQVIGNHDFDQRYQDLHNMRRGSGVYAEQEYYRYFGPTDYSFNIGKIHVITMKNINYMGRRQYAEGMTDNQLAWLEHDLSYVPKGSVVFLNLHAAGWNKYSDSGNFQGAYYVKELLKDYNVHYFCGHTHFFQNIEVTPTFYQHNIGAACGAWWAGDYSVCGAPNGYLLVDVNGTDVRWHFKPTKSTIDDQMRVYLPGKFHSQGLYVVANVWDYDPHCRVQYYEDGVLKGDMEQFAGCDEAYIYQQYSTGRKPSTELTGHLFRFKPSKGVKNITVEFTNRFGEKYSRNYNL